ncbi:hypothetical protein RM549_15005 [Salegentibacter sp. F188]|uniref:Uncharacterized protein n=1 Tax=Autumnicola patrickiae TaxID=3075591 RepID=A0ABU3E527_9FLAO|nr:hypothetical protein [Salegentibacter sp. F188]MDT0691101.1 hypothetical protein [Salegentibacter sp. F188]
MAEIRVEKKKPVWPWILLAILVILALLYFFVWADGNETDDEMQDDDQIEQLEQYETQETTDNAYPENATADYLSYIENEGDEDSLGVNPQYTREAFQKLGLAVSSQTSGMGSEPESDLENLADSTRVSNAPLSNDSIKSAGEIIVRNLEEIQRNRYPELSDEIEDLRETLNAIESTTTQASSENSEAVTRFFRRAAEVLREIPTERADSRLTPGNPTTADTAQYSTDIDTISGN